MQYRIVHNSYEYIIYNNLFLVFVFLRRATYIKQTCALMPFSILPYFFFCWWTIVKERRYTPSALYDITPRMETSTLYCHHQALSLNLPSACTGVCCNLSVMKSVKLT